jgi:hypothetical protein
MSLQETSFDYDHIVWNCSLLPYRIIVCVDCIQYIVQLREQSSYRNLSFFTEWEPIGRQYPELAMAGLPLESAGILDCEIKRRISRSKEKPADRDAVIVFIAFSLCLYSYDILNTF